MLCRVFRCIGLCRVVFAVLCVALCCVVLWFGVVCCLLCCGVMCSTSSLLCVVQGFLVVLHRVALCCVVLRCDVCCVVCSLVLYWLCVTL